MPDTAPSLTETFKPTDLRPGETGVRLVPDPYYGMVDIGPAAPPNPPPGLISPELQQWLDEYQAAIDEGWRALHREDQNRVEVITGKRLQQFPPPPRDEKPGNKPDQQPLRKHP